MSVLFLFTPWNLSRLGKVLLLLVAFVAGQVAVHAATATLVYSPIHRVHSSRIDDDTITFEIRGIPGDMAVRWRLNTPGEYLDEDRSVIGFTYTSRFDLIHTAETRRRDLEVVAEFFDGSNGGAYSHDHVFFVDARNVNSPSPRAPDLVVHDVMIENISTGQWRFRTRIVNAGSQEVDPDARIRLQYFLDGRHVGGDNVFPPLRVSEISAYETFVLEGVEIGSHVFTVEVDTDEEVPELEEDNNSRSYGFEADRDSLPDLSISSMNLERLGDGRAAVEIVVSNTGNSPFVGALAVSINYDKLSSRKTRTIRLDPFTTTAFTFSINGAVGNRGRLTVAAQVDPSNRVLERSDANNNRIRSFSPWAADLIVGPVKILPLDDGFFSLRINLENRGDVLVVNPVVRVELGEFFVKEQSFASIEPGGFQTGSILMEFPPASGIHVGTVIVDPLGFVSELSKNNNVRTFSFEIPDRRQETLVAYFPGDEGFRDQTENGFHGEVTGTIAAVDRFGQLDGSVGFQGADSVELSSGLAEVLAGSFSLQSWVYLSGRAQELTGRVDPIVGASLVDVEEVSDENPEGVLFQIRNGSTIEIAFVGPNIERKAWWEPEGFQPDTWNHLAVTFNAERETVSVYLNGDLLGRREVSYAREFRLLSTTLGSHAIGNEPSFLNGRLDDVRIHNNTLSDEEIWKDYTQDLWRDEGLLRDSPISIKGISSVGLDSPFESEILNELVDDDTSTGPFVGGLPDVSGELEFGLEFDLGDQKTLSLARVYLGRSLSTLRFKVFGSTNGEIWVPIYQTPEFRSAGEWRHLPLTGDFRYLRLLPGGPDLSVPISYVREVGVYGRELLPPDACPRFTNSEVFVSRKEGERFEIPADFLTTRPEVEATVYWRKDGVIIPGQNASSLILNPITESDAGEYVAIVEIPGCAAVVSPSTHLNVLPPPAQIYFGEVKENRGERILITERHGVLPLTIEGSPRFPGDGVISVSTATSPGDSPALASIDFVEFSETFELGGGEPLMIELELIDDGCRDGDRFFDVVIEVLSGFAETNEFSRARIHVQDAELPLAPMTFAEVKFPDRVSNRSIQVGYQVPDRGVTPLGWRFPWESRWHASGEELRHLLFGKYAIVLDSIPGYSPISEAEGGEEGLVVDLNERSGPVLRGFIYEPVQRRFPTTFLNVFETIRSRRPGSHRRVSRRWTVEGAIDRGRTPDGRRVMSNGYGIVNFPDVDGFWGPGAIPIRLLPGISQTMDVVYERFPYAGRQNIEGLHFPRSVGNTLSDFDDALRFDGLPYSFMGQVRSRAGFGTGIAVGTRVVLTAAHVLYDRHTKDFVDVVEWYPQRQAGAHESAPLRAERIYYPSDFLKFAEDERPEIRYRYDYAALVFADPVARGGSSGFVISFPEDSEPLKSSRKKALIGYPRGSGNNGRLGDRRVSIRGDGRLMASRARPHELMGIEESFEVWRSSHFVGLPGMSGGPLVAAYPKAEGTDSELESAELFFPVGIYVGVAPDGESLFRVIDEDVALLLDCVIAESELGAENHVSTGVTVVPLPSVQETASRWLRVRMEPGFDLFGDKKPRWKVQGESTWRSLPDTVIQATEESAMTIEFQDIDHWQKPNDVTVEAGETIPVSGILGRYRKIITLILPAPTPLKLKMPVTLGLGDGRLVVERTNRLRNAPERLQWESVKTVELSDLSLEGVAEIHMSSVPDELSFYRIHWEGEDSSE